jgi:hypothetical protein
LRAKEQLKTAFRRGHRLIFISPCPAKVFALNGMGLKSPAWTECFPQAKSLKLTAVMDKITDLSLWQRASFGRLLGKQQREAIGTGLQDTCADGMENVVTVLKDMETVSSTT